MEPDVVQPGGVVTSDIEGLPRELKWGLQFTQTPFIVQIKRNSYRTDHQGVVSLIYLDTTCATLDAVGFSLFGSIDGGQNYTEIVDKVDVSSRCQFRPSSATFGQTVIARSNENVWYFAFAFSSDVTGVMYKFRAQFAKDV